MSKRYYSYLLRLWQTDDPGNPTWRASLEDPITRQMTGFSSLEGLCKFLLSRKDCPDGDARPTPDPVSSFSPPLFTIKEQSNEK